MARTRTLATVALLAACASPNATIQVTLGGEPDDALTKDPAVATFELDAVQHDGTSQTIQTSSITQTSVDLGDVQQDELASLQLTGKNAANEALVFGATPFVELGALAGSTIPLFVQRKGELARMPGATLDGRAAPLLAVNARGIYYAGGAVAGSSSPLALGGYDLLFLQDFGSSCGGAPAASFALVETAQANADGVSAFAWFIDASGVTVTGLAAQDCVDYSGLVTLPKGTSWADFAGGRTVVGDDAAIYVVGPSATTASGTIFKIAPDASATNAFGSDISVFSTSTRQGAATAWAPGRGIFLYGGSATQTGAEIVSSSGAPSTFDYDPDATQGLAAIAFDQTKTMLVAGDAGPARQIDLSCSGKCTPTPWGPPLGVTLTSPSLFSLGNDVFLILGDDPSGATRAFRLTASETQPEEIFFKIPRTGARAVQTATGEIVILGGGSDVPESYFD